MVGNNLELFLLNIMASETRTEPSHGTSQGCVLGFGLSRVAGHQWFLPRRAHSRRQHIHLHLIVLNYGSAFVKLYKLSSETALGNQSC